MANRRSWFTTTRSPLAGSQISEIRSPLDTLSISHAPLSAMKWWPRSMTVRFPLPSVISRTKSTRSTETGWASASADIARPHRLCGVE